MKPIKEWTFSYWMIVYLIFMVLISFVSTLFSNAGIDIHSSYIFLMVILIHLFIVFKKRMSREKLLLRNLLLFMVLLSMVKFTVNEFYGSVRGVDITYRMFFIVLIIVFLYYYFIDKAKDRKEDEEKPKAERNIDRIIKYKHFHLIISILLLSLAYYEYSKGNLGFWFYSALILGILNIPAYIRKLYLLNKQSSDERKPKIIDEINETKEAPKKEDIPKDDKEDKDEKDNQGL